MSNEGCYFFCDAATQASLAGPGSRVLLLGSCGGFANFGDVLQLKGAIGWHRANTGLKPVLVMHTTAIPDRGFTDRLRGWYGAADILYWAAQPFDLSSVQLALLGEHAAIPHLHVYGGGFLNRYWGRGSISIIEGLIEQFGVGHYVLSGQQIDEQFVPELGAHFARHRPLLAGGRDPRSAELLADCGVEAADSFDDAIEQIDGLAASVAADGPIADAMIHLNTSYYADGPARGGLAAIAGHMAALAKHLSGSAAGEADIHLVQAYTDRRCDEIFDTMGVVLQLEDAFPFRRYRVTDLARTALEMGTPMDRGGPPLRAGVALTSSYHVTILCAAMGVPCHFLARNDYYAQKHAGLFGRAGAGDLREFLASPSVLDLSGRRPVRANWLRRLSDVQRVSPPARGQAKPVHNISLDGTWLPKPLAGESAQRMIAALEGRAQVRESAIQALTRDRADCEARLAGLISELAELKARHAALETHAAERLNRLGEAERQRDEQAAEAGRSKAEAAKLWDDLQKLSRAFNERGVVLAEKEDTCRRLWDQNQAGAATIAQQSEEIQGHRQSLDGSRAVIAELEREVRRLGWWRFWRKRQAGSGSPARQSQHSK